MGNNGLLKCHNTMFISNYTDKRIRLDKVVL